MVHIRHFVFYQVSHKWGKIQQTIRLALDPFEPTLQGSSVIYTIHGFTAGAFTPPSGEQGRLRRTYSQCGHALAGGFYCLFAFGILCSLSKVPL